VATMQSTGTRDVTYDLNSVVYHALQGAETNQMFEQDAELAGDRDAATFFRAAMDQHRQLATRAKDLLGQRIEPNGMGLSRKPAVDLAGQEAPHPWTN
jgi:hypothetical protein